LPSKNKLGKDDIARLQERNMFADEVSSGFSERLMRKPLSLVREQSLEYLAVTNGCTVLRSWLRDSQQEIIPVDSQPKTMLSLKPTIVRKPVAHLKEEMMKTYGGHGYYFLEAYIDDMTKKGRLSFI
jgi:hypothetical protein